ncbi:Hypothetical protein CINCED_3A002934 [Cinara cedri]|nr:Hypothetical protein CINCED_3A002934 [Cinara cedri]
MTVVIEQGTLEGLHYKTCVSKKPYVSFLGIPYAKPPIGDLRFKPPVKHPGWSGVLKAFSEGNACLQYDVLFTKKIVGSEDCLYLNIFIPQDEVLSDEKKSVMVFIHGGAFNLGSASTDLYCPDYLLDENVIVVSMNYRLNVLGFLNFGIDECPGNMGLKDQLFALKWVKANISVFGGDPDNITIFGESAGSASVHCHLLSPLSKGSFQRAIMQSGCIFNPWAFHEKHKEVAFKMAKKLGCKKDDPKEIVQFLLSVPAHDLVEYSKLKSKFEKDEDMEVLNYEFVPSVESDEVIENFFPAHPNVLIKSIFPVPIITGLNNMEGLIGFGEERVKDINDFKKTEEISKLLENKYNEEVINKIKNFYFNDNAHESEKNMLENICHMFSDIFFVKEFHRGFNQLLKQSVTPVYNYEFKFDGDINIFKKLLCFTRPKFLSLKGNN